MDSCLTRPSIERDQLPELLIWVMIPELKVFLRQLTNQQVVIAVAQRVQETIMRDLVFSTDSNCGSCLASAVAAITHDEKRR